MHLVFFFIRNTGIFLVTKKIKQKNPVLLSLKQGKIVISIITFGKLVNTS